MNKIEAFELVYRLRKEYDMVASEEGYKYDTALARFSGAFQIIEALGIEDEYQQWKVETGKPL